MLVLALVTASALQFVHVERAWNSQRSAEDEALFYKTWIEERCSPGVEGVFPFPEPLEGRVTVSPGMVTAVVDGERARVLLAVELELYENGSIVEEMEIHGGEMLVVGEGGYSVAS
ncbi:MAG: hypothetical protein J7L61_04675 [Thermoplasmata archaeon]|nr:hypothetical protein [Thermoplasmata archaeon]